MSHQKIIVIGAGIAGLAAARTLQEAGLPVRLLEARERIGGRMWTDRALGIPIDLGGAWVHGTINNPVAPLAEQFKAGMTLTDFRHRLGTTLAVFEADGTQVDPFLLQESRRRLETLFHQARQQERAAMTTEDITLDRLIRQNSEDQAGYDSLQQRLFQFSGYTRLQLFEGADLSAISWQRWREYTELEGGDQLLLHGYNRITDGLAYGLDIETGVVVQQIEYNAAGVRVTTHRGVKTADRIVITTPLGVLQAGSITFIPELPPEKREAISRLGMGLFEKLALRFPYQFWPAEKQVFFYLGEQQGHFPAWLNLAHYHAAPVLVAHHAGSPARTINHLPDERLIAEAMLVLRKIFGPDIPNPEAYRRTGWQNDPFSQGSYSFQKIGCQKDDRQRLAAPVDQRLFFAGEATHSYYFGTVHGAYSSGLRAAQEILAL